MAPAPALALLLAVSWALPALGAPSKTMRGGVRAWLPYSALFRREDLEPLKRRLAQEMGSNSVGRVTELENELDRATSGSRRGKFMAQLEREEADGLERLRAAGVLEDEVAVENPGHMERDYGEAEDEVAIDGQETEDEVALGHAGVWRRDGDPEEDEVAFTSAKKWRRDDLR